MNRCEYPIENLAGAVHHSAMAAFSMIEYETRDWYAPERTMVQTSRPHTAADVIVEAMFPQTWGSTALGFGGLGGQSITTAYTIIVSSMYTGEYAVYFGRRHAYTLQRPNERFFKDMADRRMLRVSESKEYLIP